MKNILEQYFIEFGQIDLLSFGCIKLQKKEASFLNDGIKEPKITIQFEPISSTPSKHFYMYLAESLSISLDQAAIQYEQFIQNLFDGQQERIEIESLGYFIFNNGVLNWNSSFSSSNYFAPVNFEKISSEDMLDNVVEDDEKDNWVLFASIIAILSLVAILFKFYH